MRGDACTCPEKIGHDAVTPELTRGLAHFFPRAMIRAIDRTLLRLVSLSLSLSLSCLRLMRHRRT